MEIDIKIHSLVIPIELAQICNPATAIVYAVMLDSTNDGIATLSNSDIGKRSGVPSRSVPAIISKLETLGLIERHYNQGYATSYHVKNILLEEEKPVEKPEQKIPEREPARRSERRQPYQKNSVEYVWRASDGSLKPAYKWYGKRNKVALTDADYSVLCSTYGKNTVDDYINRIDRFCAKKGYYYPNYDAAIEYWIEEDYAEEKKAYERMAKKDKPMSPQKNKQLDKYLAAVNVFEDNYKHYGKFKRVLLSDDDYNDLCNEYGKYKTDEYIQSVDTYLENKNIRPEESSKNKVSALMERDIEKQAKKNYVSRETIVSEWRDFNEYSKLGWI